MYSQTWANDHLRITTTCLQRPLFLGLNINVYNSVKLPLNYDHLSTTVTILGSRGWSLHTGLTVVEVLRSNLANLADFWSPSLIQVL